MRGPEHGDVPQTDPEPQTPRQRAVQLSSALYIPDRQDFGEGDAVSVATMGLKCPTIPATGCIEMPSSEPIVASLKAFRREFSPWSWAKVVPLILGTMLARGRHTVTAALRMVGLDNRPDFSKYHHVFNRDAWSPLRLARILLITAVQCLARPGARLTFAIDETLERRWGRRIRIRGHYRDTLASSRDTSVSTSGIRWIVLALIVTPPGPCRF